MSTTFLGGEGAGFRFRVQIDVVTTAIVHIYNHLGQVVAQWDDSFVAVDRLLQDATSEGDYPSLEWGQRYKPFFLLRAQREHAEKAVLEVEGYRSTGDDKQLTTPAVSTPESLLTDVLHGVAPSPDIRGFLAAGPIYNPPPPPEVIELLGSDDDAPPPPPPPPPPAAAPSADNDEDMIDPTGEEELTGEEEEEEEEAIDLEVRHFDERTLGRKIKAFQDKYLDQLKLK